MRAEIKKGGRINTLPPFESIQLLNQKSEAEWFCKKDDQCYDKGVNTERLNHCKADDQGGCNLA